MRSSTWPKSRAGRIEIEPKRLETRQAVTDAVRLTHVRAEQKGHHLQTEIVRGCPDTFADPRALTQILINLIGNAIKFTPAHGTITIRAAPHETFVEFSVSDTGPGISHEDIGRVFKPFEQLDNRYSHSEGGTGLGLALVKGLAALHGGSCMIESELGRGTTVRIRLPRCDATGERAVA